MVMGNFKGHSDRVTCCALSEDGRLLISSSEDCTVKVGFTMLGGSPSPEGVLLLVSFPNDLHGLLKVI